MMAGPRYALGMTTDKHAVAHPDAAMVRRRVHRVGLATLGDGELMRDRAIEAPVSIEVCGIG